MHMVPGHLVHAVEMREEVVALIYALLGSLHTAVYGLLAFGGNGLQSFPPRQRAQIFVRSDEVVQMRGAGAGHSGDDDGGFDFRIVYLGVALVKVFKAQTIDQKHGELRPRAQPSHRAQPVGLFN